jgi:hypothetical protein
MSSTGMIEHKPCYMCGSLTCRESMPHGIHPDWLAFVAMYPEGQWDTATFFHSAAARASAAEEYLQRWEVFVGAPE